MTRCQVSSFQPWQQMLSISECLRFVCYFQDITEIFSLHFYDLGVENEFFNREFFIFLIVFLNFFALSLLF